MSNTDSTPTNGRDSLFASASSVQDLIARLVNDPRQGEAWDEFFNRFDPFIHRVTAAACRKYLRAYSDSEPCDFAQQLYMRLIENGGRALQNFRGRTERDFRAYLIRIAYNLIHDHRRAAVDTVPLTSSPETAEAPTGGDGVRWVGKPDQEAAVERRELRDRIKAVLSQAGQGEEAQRDCLIFMLRHDGYSAKEVAKALRLTTAHVHTIYQRTKRKLAIELAKTLGKEAASSVNYALAP